MSALKYTKRTAHAYTISKLNVNVTWTFTFRLLSWLSHWSLSGTFFNAGASAMTASLSSASTQVNGCLGKKASDCCGDPR